MGTRISAAVFVVASLAAAAACRSSADTDCTCSIEENGEHSDIACGQTVCVSGIEFTCTASQTVNQQNGCSPGTPGPSGTGRNPGGSSGATPIDAGGPSPPPDTSCSDLLNYCNSACQAPPDVAANCLSAASSNDPSQCQTWQSSNGILCQP